MRWVLPDYIQDALPSEASQIESLRRRLLDAFRVRGFQLVIPPLLEFVDSLTTGSGRDLSLRTFKLADPLSGRTIGVRPDMTPQVTRIDAHLLNHRGVSRLCYCGSVLHTLPSSRTATREPLQIGAELYGHAGIEADLEILRLLAEVLRLAEVPASRIDIGHVGIFHALVARAGNLAGREEELFRLLHAKDVAELRKQLADVAEPVRSALLALPELYGDVDVLDEAAARLPDDAEIVAALAQLRHLAATLKDLPISFDLADLRGYHYHSGLVFAAYGADSAGALAQGGRYDQVGEAFGRARPATGFSMDLRQLVWHLPEAAAELAILAPHDGDETLAAEVARLRANGEIVVAALPGHDDSWSESGCSRKLVLHAGRWTVVPLLGD